MLQYHVAAHCGQLALAKMKYIISASVKCKPVQATVHMSSRMLIRCLVKQPLPLLQATGGQQQFVMCHVAALSSGRRVTQSKSAPLQSETNDLSCRAEEEGGSGRAVRPAPNLREVHKRERQLYSEQEAGRRSQAAAEPLK